MEYREQHVRAQYLIKLSRGEKVMETLTAFCGEHGIENGILHAIGAVRDTRMGYYDPEQREYFFSEYPETMEVISMTGNIARVDTEEDKAENAGVNPFLHVHAVLSDTQNKAHGGHIDETTVAVTLEVHLSACTDPVERVYDDDIGLKLLSL